MSFPSFFKSPLIKAVPSSHKPRLFWGAAHSMGYVLLWGQICPAGDASAWAQLPGRLVPVL